MQLAVFVPCKDGLAVEGEGNAKEGGEEFDGLGNLPGGKVPHEGDFVGSNRNQVFVIGGEGDALYGAAVAFESGAFCAAFHVPHLDGLVSGGGVEALAVAADGKVVDAIAVAFDNEGFIAAFDRPAFDGFVPGAGEEPTAVWRDLEGANPAVVFEGGGG